MQIESHAISDDITISIFREPVSGVTKSYSYRFSNECAINFCTFDELLQTRKKEAPHLPFMIAKVKDVAGGIHFYDGALLYTHLKKYFTNPSSNIECKSIKYYKILQSTGSVHIVEELERWASKDDRDRLFDKTKVACYVPHNNAYRMTHSLQCLSTYRIDEGMYWAKICAQDPNSGVNADLLCATAFAVATEADDTATSKKLLKKAIAVNPNHVDALERLGKIYFTAKSSKADAYFERTLAQDPNNAAALVHLGVLLQDQDCHRAKQLLKQAIYEEDVQDPQLLELAIHALMVARAPRSCAYKLRSIFARMTKFILN